MGACRNPATINQSNLCLLVTSYQIYLLHVFPSSDMLPVKTDKNFKGRSPNALWYIKSCGNEEDVGSLISPNPSATTRLSAKNENQALDKKTTKTNELWLISLEQFAEANGVSVKSIGVVQSTYLILP